MIKDCSLKNIQMYSVCCRRSEMQSETEDTVYYISDAETCPGDSFEFSEAECDMHLRLAMEERP
ncbi:hypothetical protein CDAR_8081, partial [Caerostris darwini]